MLIGELREKANNLPLLSGVYLMLSDKGEVIYVGKAKKLKNRVSSYFRGDHDAKTSTMVSKVNDFNVIVTSNEFEALILENSLIKRHKPHYNILLKDDKAYPFIVLDYKSTCPKFTVTNKIGESSAKYFGPFGGRSITRSIIDTVCKTLKLPTCNKTFPKDFGKNRPCLNYHMGNCLGYCASLGKIDDYQEAIHEAELVLSGKSNELKMSIKNEMEQAAENLDFEKAALLRDKFRALESLENKQRVIGTAHSDADALGFYRGAKSCFTVLHYVKGTLASKDYEIIDEPFESDAEAISALVRQYYSIRLNFPKEILLPFETEDFEDLGRYFSEIADKKVLISSPSRGDKRFMVEKAMVNAKEESLRITTLQERRNKTLELLRDAISMEKLPRRIEAFDISNTGNFGIVASMVVFKDGKPLKRDYRKFKLKEVLTADDYASMHEVLERRFRRYLDNDEKFNELPDLLLIDGGATHCAVAEDVLKELNIKIPAMGMVKDDRHRTRALTYSDGREVGIKNNQSLFVLIGTIQEEVHRFAIEYHRSLRRGTLGSSLEDIAGVGEKRRNDLLAHFKSLKAIKEAELSELQKIVPKNAALAVFKHFNKDKIEGENK